MTGVDFEATLNRYGIDNLRVIMIDNSRFHHLEKGDVEKGRVLFNHEDEYMDVKEIGRDGMTPTIVHIPYDVIQSLVFKDNNPDGKLGSEE